MPAAESSDKQHILTTIRLLRESFGGAETVYTCGSCYQLYKILRHHYPGALDYITVSGHVVTRIGDCFYDIFGEYPPDKSLTRLDKEYARRLESHRADVQLL